MATTTVKIGRFLVTLSSGQVTSFQGPPGVRWQEHSTLNERIELEGHRAANEIASDMPQSIPNDLWPYVARTEEEWRTNPPPQVEV